MNQLKCVLLYFGRFHEPIEMCVIVFPQISWTNWNVCYCISADWFRN